MKLLILSMLAAQALAAPLDFADALKLADANEAALDADAKAALMQSQDAALRTATAGCVSLAPGRLPAFTIVMELDADGRALNSWRDSDLPMVRCVERELRNGAYRTTGKGGFFMSFVVSFTP